MRYTTDIRGTRVGGETAGGSVSGRWSLVASAEILGCPGPPVRVQVWVCMVLWNSGFMVPLDFWIFGFYGYLLRYH